MAVAALKDFEFTLGGGTNFLSDGVTNAILKDVLITRRDNEPVGVGHEQRRTEQA
jgi:hypothetical protein